MTGDVTKNTQESSHWKGELLYIIHAQLHKNTQEHTHTHSTEHVHTRTAKPTHIGCEDADVVILALQPRSRAPSGPPRLGSITGHNRAQTNGL